MFQNDLVFRFTGLLCFGFFAFLDNPVTDFGHLIPWISVYYFAGSLYSYISYFGSLYSVLLDFGLLDK